jgi:hypothetical protein
MKFLSSSDKMRTIHEPSTHTPTAMKRPVFLPSDMGAWVSSSSYSPDLRLAVSIAVIPWRVLVGVGAGG